MNQQDSDGHPAGPPSRVLGRPEIDVTPSTLEGDYSEKVPVSDRGYRRLGMLILGLGLGGFLAWSATASLAVAVVAPGHVAVESLRRTVQHLEGGIVREILVADGDRVEAGQPLVVIDDLQARAELQIMRTQFLAGRATELRLLAEQAGAEALWLPEEITASDLPRVQEVLAVQQALFAARGHSHRATLEALDEQAEQLRRQGEGLEEVMRINEHHAASLREEERDLRVLFEKGMVNNQRLREVERNRLELEGSIASRRAELARLASQISENRMQREIRDQEFRKDVGEQLREVQARVAEAEERITTLLDRVGRSTITAPVAGTVVERRVHSIGDVVGSGDPLLDIVPGDNRFVVEARVPDRDVNQLFAGQLAEIRFSAFNQRLTNVIPAEVILVSADSQVDEATGARFYRVRLRVTEAGREEMAESMQLLAGMPAEVMIRTGERTFASYITKPIIDMLARAIREE